VRGISRAVGEGVSVAQGVDGDLLVDIDLSILGADVETYRHF
jgi:predicted metal-dependent HD superfamily phosphohydrolase